MSDGVCAQTLGENAPSQLILYHYPDLKEEKGIVLMTAELDLRFIVSPHTHTHYHSRMMTCVSLVYFYSSLHVLVYLLIYFNAMFDVPHTHRDLRN